MLGRVSKAFNHHAAIVRELEESRERLLSFLHAVGHDIRTPFVGIDTTMQLLELDAERLSEAELRAHVVAAARSVRTACTFGLSMSGDLFELIRSDTGRWQLSPAHVDLREVAESIRTIVEPQATAKGLAVIVRPMGCVADGFTLWTDENRLKQSLVNVAANAVKFSTEGAVEIELSAPSPEAFIVTVRDRGPGLDEASLERIFEPFHQSERTAAQAGEGLGLGLAIADRCARLLGGRWTAANRRDGHGAEFTLLLPRRPLSRTTEVADARARGAGGTRSVPISAHILVVDDASDAARLAQHHIVALGHRASVATTIAAAEKLLASERFDLVLADYELPDGTAEDLLRRAGNVPVLVSSARVKEALAGVRAAGLVPKPISRAALETAIGTALGTFRASGQP